MNLDSLFKDNPFTKNEYVVVAVSTGIDSMCLLNMLLEYKQKVVICFVNHHTRKQIINEEAFLKEFSSKKNIPLEILDYYQKASSNFQQDARNARYAFFYQTALKYKAKYILTAHHQNDNLESIMINFIKGSNLYGYGGISKLVKYKDIFIYRPLLDISRNDIKDYCDENKIIYFEDESNAKDKYLRNRIRHLITPILEKENPNLYQAIKQYSTILKESFAYIRRNSLQYLNEHKTNIILSSFKDLDVILKKDILNYLLEEHNLNSNYNLISDLLRIIENDKPQATYTLSNNYLFIKEYNRCYLKKKDDFIIKEITLSLEEQVIFNDKYRFYLTKNLSNNNENYLKICYNDLKLPLVIRTRKDGDYMNLPFGKKKLKSIFIDKKIPSEIRKTTPIVTNNEGEILWVLNTIKKPTLDTYIYLVCEELCK